MPATPDCSAPEYLRELGFNALNLRGNDGSTFDHGLVHKQKFQYVGEEPCWKTRGMNIADPTLASSPALQVELYPEA